MHPSGRIIVLERDCDWRRSIFELENQMKIAGWVYFVVFVETFSGRFRLECVENHNKYLKNGYISTLFDKAAPLTPSTAPARLTPGNGVSSLEALDEVESGEEAHSDEEPASQEGLESTASTTAKAKGLSPTPRNLLRMKISCWNFNAKTYRKRLPLELAGKKAKAVFEASGLEDVLVVNRERTSALAKNLRAALTLAEYSLFR